MQLSLQPHVHACFDNGVVVLLDVRANRYFAIPPSLICQEGDPIGGLPAGHARLNADGVRLLRKQGAVVDSEQPRAEVQVTAGIRTRAELCERPAISAMDSLRFGLACAFADVAVRRGALDAVVTSIASAKKRVSKRNAIMPASVFSRLRIWYPHARVCLFDSLALARFLAWNRCAFDLVFAVRSRPFAAHCWIESNGVALNDFYDTHAAFTPILRV